MPLHVPKLAAYSRFYDNANANPTSTPGQAINTSYGGSAEADFSTLVTSANCSEDVYAISLQFHNAAYTATENVWVFELGVDEAGGSNFTTVIEHMLMGTSRVNSGTGPYSFLIPIFIPAGSSIGIRGYGGHSTTPNTLYCNVRLYGKRRGMAAFPVGSFAETFPKITNPPGVSIVGTSITPGNATDGEWAELGTLTKPLWWWQLGHALNNGVVTAEYTYIDLAWGDATNKQIIMRDMHAGRTNEQYGLSFTQNHNFFNCYAFVPAGASIYARGRCLNAPDTGYSVMALGIGG